MKLPMFFIAAIFATETYASGINMPMPHRLPATAAPAPIGTTTAEKPLEVKGQARSLSMRLILQNKKDRIEFVEHRKDYRREVLGTRF